MWTKADYAEETYPVTDNFGRRCGGWYLVYKIEADAGTIFTVDFGGLRNGEQYQSSKHADGRFDTLEAAQAVGKKKLADMGKRLARKFRQPATA